MKNEITINLKHINKPAEKVFKTLISLMKNDYAKIDNTNETFMPIIIEQIYHENVYGKVYSLTHYYKQNSDLMRDPEMTFLVNDDDNKIYPLSFQQDGRISTYEENAIFLKGKLYKINRKLNNQHKNFANKWLQNIKEQQSL
jgi:hypothetical protein